jgi:hypothetical protein
MPTARIAGSDMASRSFLEDAIKKSDRSLDSRFDRMEHMAVSV